MDDEKHFNNGSVRERMLGSCFSQLDRHIGEVVFACSMDSDELRPFVLEFLKTAPTDQALDVVRIVNGVETKLLERGEYKDLPETWYGTLGRHKMPEEDMEKIRQIISQLVNQDVLTWGWNIENPAPPSLRVTDYGRESLQASEPIVHDPDGYLIALKREIPTLDPTIEMYVREALEAYLAGLMLSSTVMLGGAAEKAFLLLIEKYGDALSDSQNRSKFKKDTAGSIIKRKIDAFNGQIPRFKDRLPSRLKYDIDIQLQAIFNLIRTCRNDVGHPTGRIIDRRLAFANLQVFIGYSKRVYDLMNFFQPNSIP